MGALELDRPLADDGFHWPIHRKLLVLMLRIEGERVRVLPELSEP